MGYADADPAIIEWANRHSLCLAKAFAGRPARFVYLSSIAGDVFQIWIDEPTNNTIALHAAGVEGMLEDDPPRSWLVNVNCLGAALEEALQLVLDWMQPFGRYVPTHRIQ